MFEFLIIKCEPHESFHKEKNRKQYSPLKLLSFNESNKSFSFSFTSGNIK